MLEDKRRDNAPVGHGPIRETHAIETDVLVVGGGPAGLTAAAFLATYGIRTLLITKYGWLSDTPRAHITNQGTMEVLRDLGVEAKATALATPQALMGSNVFCRSLAGEEFGRVRSWGTHPARQADYDLASPTSICDLPQTYLEPVLLEAAASRGSTVRFNAEFLDLVQDPDGVTATVKDRTIGEMYTIRCKYLLGADGARSRVAEVLGLPMEGKMGRSGSMNIVFDADLSRYVAHRPSVLYWILQPGAETDGIGAGVIRMVRPWNQWLAIWGYDSAKGELQLTPEAATGIVRNMIGDPDVAITIRSTSTWTVNEMVATRYVDDRVLCMGDAVHRHPPLNGLGSNTSIQDAYNLAWKLAFVLRGQAAPSLLDSYELERQPIGRQIVARANRSIADYPPIFDALGMFASADPHETNAAISARRDATSEGKERRRRLYAAITQKNYEFNTHGVELNHRYRSLAVVSDGAEPPPYKRDAELYYEATTFPGARLPHVWIEHEQQRKSTLDLCGQGRFTVLTGIGGECWVKAARNAAARFGIPIATFIIGPAGCDAMDIYADWYQASEIEEDGCILVRPDVHVAWRTSTAMADASERLVKVLTALLGHPET